MVAFPFIPVLVYALIISAFSYISARILKHFNFNSHLLAFLRRQDRFTSLPITCSHELLPTSTASPLARPPIGVYADSSNVTPRSTSLDALSALPPRLISPASSPPGHSQPHRVTNPSYISFSILKPTLYRHKQRRSRSLGTPTFRPPHWSSHFPPSPPMQREAIRRRSSEEDIPLSVLSRSAEYLPHEHRTLVPSPILHASPMPTSMSDSDFHSSIYGPLIDVSLPPLSPAPTSLSSCQNSSLAGLSHSGFELAPHSYPASSDSGSPSSAQSADIGVQPIGDLHGFAYDWGFSNVSNTNSDKSYSRVDLHEPSPLPLLPGVPTGERDVTVVTEKQSNEDVSHDSRHTEIVEQATYDAIQTDLTPLVRLDEPPLADNVSQSVEASSGLLQPDLNVDEEILIDRPTSPPTSELPISSTLDESKDDENSSILVGDDREIHGNEVIMERLDDDLWNEPNASALLPPPRVIVQGIDVEERPLIAIDNSESVNASDSLSAKAEAYPLPISPSQTPTPPASPPLNPVSASKPPTGSGKSQIRVATILPTSEPASPAKVTVEITKIAEVPEIESSPVLQELGQAGPEYDDSIAEDKTSPARSDINLTCSPRSALPAWSIRAADAPPLGLGTTQAASVQDEVLWPNSNPGTQDEDVQKPKADEMSENPTEKSTRPVADGQAESGTSTPGTFLELESKEPTLVQRQAVNEPASSTTVTIASGLSRRRQAVRGFPIDVALAMQLRPGLGVGADPAWMVRFLMAVFGWFAIMIAGRGGEVDAYAS